MKELDFDELDKAVNSLMAGVPKTPVPSGDTPEKTVDIPSTAPDVTRLPAASPSPSTRSTPPSAPASRRGGRFMDVVHPSSAMKKPESARPVSRQGITLVPSSPTAPVQEQKAPDTPQPTPLETPVKPPEVLSEPAAPKSDWPDPLEVANFTDSKDEKPELDSKSSNESPVTPMVKPEEPAIETPLVSPFLPDTKVEKRPLGANVSEVSPDAKESEAPSDLPATQNDDQLPATTEDVKPLLPEELHSDLVAIESDTTSPSDKEDTAKPEKAETPWVAFKQEPEKDVSEAASEPELKEKEKEKETPTPVGPSSIPQQYREEPSTGDQKNGAIYDTDSYHQPLAHPAKQKSGWMWIVWILVILVVGAGGGAAVYFLGLV